VAHPGVVVSETLRARFLREAELASRLNHPAIVTIHEFGECDGLCYITEEYCDGGSLAAWLATRPGPVEPRLAAAIVLAIAVSFLSRETALMPPKLAAALKEGTTGVLNVATTCAAAGIIVGVVTLTGLAQRFADIIIGYAGGNLLLTALFSAAIGSRFFFAANHGFRLEVRDYSFLDSYRVNIVRATARAGGDTGEETKTPGITNLVQFDLGYTFIF
jgi:hypothetical protein